MIIIYKNYLPDNLEFPVDASKNVALLLLRHLRDTLSLRLHILLLARLYYFLIDIIFSWFFTIFLFEFSNIVFRVSL